MSLLHRIPGLPGASDPAFRTRDARWMDLDRLVVETCQRLGARGETFSPGVVKATIQVARYLVQVSDLLAGRRLVKEVVLQLRCRRVILQPRHVEAILRAYATLAAELDIQETAERAPRS